MENTDSARGLKDHEIAELVNALRNTMEITFNVNHCYLRGVISAIVNRYLEDNGLKINKH